MANEITVLIDGNVSNGNVTNIFSPGSFQLDQNNARIYDQVLNIGTTEETISFTDFTTTAPLVFLLNLDSTNYVQFGLTTSYTGRLVAGDPPAFFRLDAGASLRLKANTAACEVRIVAYDL